jgi:hypothetical protein
MVFAGGILSGAGPDDSGASGEVAGLTSVARISGPGRSSCGVRQCAGFRDVLFGGIAVWPPAWGWMCSCSAVGHKSPLCPRSQAPSPESWSSPASTSWSRRCCGVLRMCRSRSPAGGRTKRLGRRSGHQARLEERRECHWALPCSAGKRHSAVGRASPRIAYP